LQKLKDANIEIALIHYNDSKFPFGSKKDRHAPPLYGCLGFKELNETLEFAIKYNIPCVHE